ncbi:hypothetical protein N657DRAFT_674603 [Parathielavia appendiculata]|uniref:Uncharacterized protein n=1 Tax=Parathielavia appendiculata TaxID=2587402 RepID=A0AAN6TT20_9PEZI|nr:hypothetical protein N657DRAFT_674603 [Parathielavia appendiculata]
MFRTWACIIDKSGPNTEQTPTAIDIRTAPVTLTPLQTTGIPSNRPVAAPQLNQPAQASGFQLPAEYRSTYPPAAHSISIFPSQVTASQTAVGYQQHGSASGEEPPWKRQRVASYEQGYAPNLKDTASYFCQPPSLPRDILVTRDQIQTAHPTAAAPACADGTNTITSMMRGSYVVFYPSSLLTSPFRAIYSPISFTLHPGGYYQAGPILDLKLRVIVRQEAEIFPTDKPSSFEIPASEIVKQLERVGRIASYSIRKGKFVNVAVVGRTFELQWEGFHFRPSEVQSMTLYNLISTFSR